MPPWKRYAFILLLLPVFTFGEDGAWPGFRGPNGSGVGEGSGYPVEVAPGKAAWKAAVPFGQSSPVVTAGRVYLTASEGDQLITICLDADTGKELWRRMLNRTRAQKTYPANDPASPTPAADASGVYAFFADFGLVAHDADGTERWRMALGPFKNFYGMAASPILVDGAVVLVLDQQAGSFLIAVDAESGKLKWRTERKGASIGWATPMVYRPTDGPAQLVVLGSTRLDGYFLETGEPLWWMALGSGGALGVPVAGSDALFVSTLATAEPWMPTFESALEKHDEEKDGVLTKTEFEDDEELGPHFGWIDANEDDRIVAEEWNDARQMGIGEFGAIALRPGKARGQIQSSDVLWRFQKNLPYIPAPLFYDGVFYMIRTGGIITSLDPATGEVLKQGRTREALGEYYASPIAADGKVYVASTEGKVTVLKAGGQWDVLTVNDFGEELHATPALSGGSVYVRTKSALYCFRP